MIDKKAVVVEDVREELERHYQKIFEKLHAEPSFPKGKRVYSNSYHLTSVAVTREHVPEFTFVCLARNRDTKRLEEYYVSQPYNVNIASNFTDDSVTGYFVFRYIGKANVFVLHSFAEEPAKRFVSSRVSNEELYLRARENCEVASTSEDDPLCRLSDYQKMRICALIDFGGTVGFTPSMNCVVTEYSKRRVSFQEERAKAVSEDANVRGMWYEEWMMGCRVLNFKHFYVSRGYSTNNVFVYKSVYGNNN